MPLAIGLRIKESVWIGEAKVTILKTGAEVKLSIEAPRTMPVVRDELKRRDALRKEADRAQP